MPAKKAYDNLKKGGIAVDKCPYNTLDSLETAEDIEVLNNLCQSYKDKTGKLLKVTANLSNPDFDKIKLITLKSTTTET